MTVRKESLWLTRHTLVNDSCLSEGTNFNKMSRRLAVMANKAAAYKFVISFARMIEEGEYLH